MESLVSIAIAALALSVLIFVHELAHLLAGKAVGIHAEVFSIGFGPALYKFRRGATEYRVAVIPAGGYVRFPGEYEQEEGRLSGAFHSAPVWKRMAVAGAGPASNILLGVAVYAALAMYGMPEERMPPLGEIVQSPVHHATMWDDPTDVSPAAEAGLQPLDQVLSVNGRDVRSWEEFTNEIVIRPERPLTLRIRRDGRPMEVAVTPRAVLRGKVTVGQIGVAAHQPMALLDGDEMRRIQSVGGVRFYGWQQLRRALSGRPEAVVLLQAGGRPTQARIRSEVILTGDAAGAPTPDEPPEGWTVAAINGAPVATLDEVRAALLQNPASDAVLTLSDERGRTTTRTLRPDLHVQVAGVNPDQNGDVRMLRLGDRLIAVNGVALAQVTPATLDGASPTVRLTFERSSRLLTFQWTRPLDVQTSASVAAGHARIPGLSLRSNFGGDMPVLDVGPASFVERFRAADAQTGARLSLVVEAAPLTRYAPVPAVAKGIGKTRDTVQETLSLLKRLIIGEVSVRYISGPVGIVNATQRTLRRGGWTLEAFLSVFYLMAFISVNLAIINLLPIPIADGGQLLFFALEGARGRPLDVKWQAAIQHVSIVILIGLFALVTLKDLVYW
jgi:regulator of sigma E protease